VAGWVGGGIAAAFFASLERCSCVNVRTHDDLDDDEQRDSLAPLVLDDGNDEAAGGGGGRRRMGRGGSWRNEKGRRSGGGGVDPRQRLTRPPATYSSHGDARGRR
jgi:hypothetical protein